jgi:hypothetical protein
VAKNVYAGTITSSPGPMPAALSISTRASVPLPVATAAAAPVASHSALSSASTAAPDVNSPRSTTDRKRFSYSGQFAARSRAPL